MKTIRKRWQVSLAFLALLLYVLLIAVAPEVGNGSLNGPRSLNTQGFGYNLGDVVWLSDMKGQYKSNDVALYDWTKFVPGGFGPPHVLRRVVACPQDTIEVRHNEIVINSLAISGTPNNDLFHRFLIPLQGKYVLPHDVYLICDDSESNRLSFIPVTEDLLRAKIRCKLGRNFYETWRLEHIVY